MLYIIKTGNPDTDTFLLNELKQKLSGEFVTIQQIDDNTLEQINNILSNQNLFTQKRILIFNKLDLNKDVKNLIKPAYKHTDIILVNCKKFTKTGLDKNYIIEKAAKFDFRAAYKALSNLLNRYQIYDKFLLNRLLEQIQIKDQDNIIYSRLLLSQLEKRFSILYEFSNKDKKLFKTYIQRYLLQNNSQFTNPWILTEMFLNNKLDNKITYFNNLEKEVDVYYTINRLKSNLFLLVAVYDLMKRQLSYGIIAKKLGKNPYYVKKLIELITNLQLTRKYLIHGIKYIFTIELDLKSGILDKDLAWYKLKHFTYFDKRK